MSNCRTFNRSSRQEQNKSVNPGIISINQLAHERIAANPEKFVEKIFYLLEVKNSVNAAGLIVKLAGGALIVPTTDSSPRRSRLVEKWAAELAQVDKENAEKEAREKAEKEAQEAAAASEASSRELGQISMPEAEIAPETVAQPAPEPAPPAPPHSNTLANEIGLPAYGQPQILGAPSIRRTLPNGWDNHRRTTGSTEQVFLTPVP